MGNQQFEDQHPRNRAGKFTDKPGTGPSTESDVALDTGPLPGEEGSDWSSPMFGRELIRMEIVGAANTDPDVARWHGKLHDRFYQKVFAQMYQDGLIVEADDNTYVSYRGEGADERFWASAEKIFGRFPKYLVVPSGERRETAHEESGSTVIEERVQLVDYDSKEPVTEVWCNTGALAGEDVDPEYAKDMFDESLSTHFYERDELVFWDHS